MDLRKDIAAITDALSYMAQGKAYIRRDYTISWVPETISEEKAPAFIQAVRTAYEQDQTEMIFEDTKYEVQFVAEKHDLRIKPGFAGKTNVVLNEQIVKSFSDMRQAKVFYAFQEHALKTAPKKPFANTVVASVRVL